MTLRGAAVLVVLMSCAAPQPPTSGDTGRVDPELAADLSAGKAPLALVELEGPDDAQALAIAGPAWSDAELERRAALLDERKRELRAAVPGVQELDVYRHLPLLSLRVVDPSTLAALAAQPGVKRVHANRAYQHALAQSLPLINQPAAAAAGKTGAGVTVAVLDTGLDYRGAAFGSWTVAGTPSSCKVAAAQDFAPEDGALDDNGHGTNVAGIVLGVAPGARVLGLDVFSGGVAYSNHILSAIDWCIQNRTTYAIAALNMSLGGGSNSAVCGSDVFASAITTAKGAGILSAVAAGNNGYTAALSSPACTPDAVSVGAVYDANLGGLAYSACSDATTAADKVTCFSNSASFLTLLAPGSMITAAGITMSGTSQASPHVAGAIAVLAAAFPGESMALRLQRLTTSGTSIRDARNGVTKPRLDLAAATSSCAVAASPTSASVSAKGGTLTFTVSASQSCPWTAAGNGTWVTVSSTAAGTGPATVSLAVAPNGGAARSASVTVAGTAVTIAQAGDVTPPQGTVVIAGGEAFTRTTAVTLALSATDDGAVSAMCLTNATTCTAWQPYASAATWTLAGGSGEKTVRAFFKDAAGNVSAAATDTIVLDATLPTNGTLVAGPGNTQVSLSWSGFTDAHSGIASYRVMSQANTPPSSCTVGVEVYRGSATTAVHQGLANGLTFGYRVCAFDNAGNVSSGATATSRTAPELEAPVGTIAIAGGVTLTRLQAVTLNLTATDPSGVATMCLSNAATCTSWVAYAKSASWTLSAGAGVKTVSARFRDRWGNESAPVSTSVTYDPVAPSGGSLYATAGVQRVLLSWSGITDAISGVTGYTLSFAVGIKAPACGLGTVVYSGPAGSFLHEGLQSGVALSYRLCATDAAGNVSTGLTRTVTPL